MLVIVVSCHILAALEKVTQYEDFEEVLSQKWRNFKQLTLYYFALLQSSNGHYQKAYFTSMQTGVYLNVRSQQSIFPIPVIALNLFKTIVVDKYQQKIQNSILQSIRSYRRQMKTKSQNLKNILQLLWSCGMGELARIRIVPGVGLSFYKQEKVEFVRKIKVAMSQQQYFAETILSLILKQTETYYTQDYQTRIRSLFPIEQIRTIKQKIDREFEFSEEFLIGKKEKRVYMNKVYEKLILNDLQERLRAQGSFKTLIENFRFNSVQGLQDIKVFFDVLKGAVRISEERLRAILKPVQKIVSEVILEQGKQINHKLNKRREYITEMLSLKKSIDRILEEFSNKNVILLSVKDKAFKRILDSIEASRNLSDFTDFTIKQCMRLKLDEQRCIQKFSDVFLLLNSTTSTDSFLLYHQQSLAKRLIQCLNQPRLEFEMLMLKKLSERLGVMSVSSHMSMIRDIESSQELTEKYNNRLPFSSFKWNLKVFNPSYWPDAASKQRLQIQLPLSLLPQARAIQDLYHTQNQYRYLNWKLEKGTSLFEGRFQTKKIRFQSQNSYMMILLLIAEQPLHRIIYGNLRQLVKIGKNQMKNDPLQMILFVLIQSRLLLRKSSEDKFAMFSLSEELEVNRNFTVPEGLNKGQQVISIRPSAEMAKNLQHSSIQKNKVLKDRQKLIQAVLVKLLKHSHATGNNSITFTQLYKAIKQHHILGGFDFSQGVVKQRLQQLIARQYCIRDQDDRRIYHYVA